VRPVAPGMAPSRAAPGEQATAGRSATGVAPTERNEHGRDTTPRASAPMRGRPARSMQQTYKPSLIVIGGLLLIALVVAILLWVMAGTDDDPQSSTADTSVAANTRGERDPASASTVPAGPASIAGLSAVHFNGRTGTTDDQTPAAEADNDPATVWPTECYSDRFLGGVPVGLRVDLDRASTGTLTFDVLSNPYQVNVYGVRGATPTSRDGWGQPIGGTRTSIDGRQQVTVRIDATPARHLLIEFIELGQDPGCSGANPYRGLLGDVTFSS
jgi:hypothetical protein